jgi:CelD/BcsL family acetyltransferase involved in cellulose biosynthesis
MNLEIIKTREDFIEIKNDWNSLTSRLEYCPPYQKWEWNYLYWNNFGENKDLQIIIIKNKDKLLAIFPFIIRNQFGFHILEPIGTRGTDYINILIDPIHQNEILSIFLEWFLKNDIDLINLEDIPATAPYLNALQEQSSNLSLSNNVNYTYCPCFSINLPDSWDKYLNSLSKRAKNDIKYYRRYCSNEFKQILYVQGQSSDMDKHYELHQKCRGIKNDAGTYKSQTVRDFMREYAKSLESENKLRLIFLSLDNNIVASILGVEEANKRYNISIGYNPDYRRYRPGTILYGYDMEDCIKRRLLQYDLSRGLDAYKIRMGTTKSFNTRTIISKSMDNIPKYLQFNANYMRGRDYAPSGV